MQNLSNIFREAYPDRFASADVSTEHAIIRYANEGGGLPDPDPVAQHEDLSKKEARGRHNGHVNDVAVQMGDTQVHMTDGSVAIAAITSCTNTSNPSVMIAAGLLAKHAVERGLSVKPSVKTSLAPGSAHRADAAWWRSCALCSHCRWLFGYGEAGRDDGSG